MSAIAATADIVAELRAQAPAFAARSADADARRSAPPETVAAMQTLGAHRLLQPRAFNGAERGVRDHCQVIAALSEGCMATGWCAAVWSAHNWMLALLGHRAQAEVWAAPEIRISASITPREHFQTTPDGVVVTGRFPFGSGADHAGGFAVGGIIDVNGEPDTIIAPVPSAAVTIDQASWQVMGLRGTGSKDLVVSEPTLVPWHQVLRMSEVGRGASAGQTSGSALYRAPFRCVAALVLAPPALGAARAAVNRFIARLDHHPMPLIGLRSQRADPAARLRIAESEAEIDAAEAVLLQAAEICDALGRTRHPDPLAEARVLRDTAFCVRLCASAVDRLFEAAGGSALGEQEPLQRLWRDIMAARSHIVLTWDAAAHTYAHARLGPAS